MTALEQIYQNLQQGKKYGYYYSMRVPCFHTALWLDCSKKYIFWNHFGESSNANTINDLEWIIDRIFRCSPEQFIENFPVYDDNAMREWEKIAYAQGTDEYRKWDPKTFKGEVYTKAQDAIRCEASHYGLSVQDYDLWLRLQRDATKRGKYIALCKNAETEAAFDEAIQKLTDFEISHQIPACAKKPISFYL